MCFFFFWFVGCVFSDYAFPPLPPPPSFPPPYSPQLCDGVNEGDELTAPQLLLHVQLVEGDASEPLTLTVEGGVLLWVGDKLHDSLLDLRHQVTLHCRLCRVINCKHYPPSFTLTPLKVFPTVHSHSNSSPKESSSHSHALILGLPDVANFQQ